MRIGVISPTYDPERNSAAQTGIVTRALRDAGHQVQVLTGFPNYPEGRLYPGYRLRPYQQEVMDGIRVHRVPIWPSHDRNPVRRAANYLSFAATGPVGAAATLRGADAALVYCSQATAGAVGMALRTVRGIPFVLYIQDLWPQTITASGMVGARTGAALAAAVHPYTDLLYRLSSGVAVTSPGMADAIAARGVPRSKLRFVPNWAREDVFHPAPRDPALARELGILDRPFTVMYAGNLGAVQDLGTLLGAAQRLRERSDIGFAIVGDGVLAAELRERAERERLTNVVFCGPRPVEDMPRVLALGDLQIVSLVDEPLFAMTLPSKIQSTFASGRPVLGSLRGDAARVVTEADAGLVVTPESPDEMAAAIVRAAADPARLAQQGRNGLDYYRQRMSQERGVATLGALLEDAAASR